jgi:2-polyprenyl-6-methoxyphenol hydroxylase-like FAD-dependent oxidoreductase
MTIGEFRRVDRHRPKTPRIAVIGAGIGGLGLAQGLARAGIDCEIFERDPAIDSRGQGYRLRIDATGQQALRECLPTALMSLFEQSCATAASGGRFLDTDLQPVASQMPGGRMPESWRDARARSTRPGDKIGDRAGDLRVHRQTLREILFCGLDRRVRFGKVFASAEAFLADDGRRRIRLGFTDGSSTRCDLIVAADGVNSAVRGNLLPVLQSRVQPVDTGTVCFFGRTHPHPGLTQPPADLLLDGSSVIFADGFTTIIDAMHFADQPDRLARHLLGGFAESCILSPAANYLYWAFIGPRATFGLRVDGVLPQEPSVIAELLRRRVRGWHPGLAAVFDATDLESLAVMPLRQAPLPSTWRTADRMALAGARTSGVTWLGDAIHAMSPAGGLGANTALADAADLSARLRDVARGETDLGVAISAYETEMLARAETALAASAAAASRLFGGRRSDGPGVD